MHEKNHVLEVLENTKEAIKNQDVARLKELSNQTIHTASTEQDTDSITVAIIVYSISKMVERENQDKTGQCSEFCSFSQQQIEKAINSLKSNDENSFRKSLQAIINSVRKLSPDLKRDIENVFRKARINKATKIYEHGISMEQTAELLGITMYELAEYAGQRQDRNVPLFKTKTAKDRIKLAMDFFK